jgi:branched-chain amino acid transport system permease protein
MGWIDTVVQGILLGGLFALFALGLAVIYGVMKLINIAHGDFIVLGAYLALGISGATHRSPFVVLPLVIVVFMLFGYVLQRTILNRTLGRDILVPLVVTYGLSVVIQNVLLQTTSADSRSLKVGGIETASIALPGGLAIGWLPLITLLTALVATALLEWIFNHTRLGIAFRAASDDRETANLMGVDDLRLYGYATAIALGVVAVAALFMGIKFEFTPDIGPNFLLYAFEAVVIGGLGSFWGTFLGGIVLGVAQAVGFAIDPGWGILLGHLVFLAVLVLRPSGLIPRPLAA